MNPSAQHHHPLQHPHLHPGGGSVGLGPIGVVAAQSPVGPVGLGIGVPLMTSPGHLGQFSQKRMLSSSGESLEHVSNGRPLFLFNNGGCSPIVVSTSSGSPHLSSPQVSNIGNNGTPALRMAWSGSPQAGYPIMGHHPLPVITPQPYAHSNLLYGLFGPGNNGSPQGNPLNLNIPPVASQSPILPLLASPPMPSCPPSPPESSYEPPEKDILHCKTCTLFPPNPSAPLPTTREKPPGCRTVFVGGLPEAASEDLIHDSFSRCGEISTVRMSKKNFCHIRFESAEASLGSALSLSGYRVRIGSNSDPASSGRLHVDYAQARDDLYEWECRQRQAQREARHRERPLSPPNTPSIVPYYSDHEASLVSEKIKSDESFLKGISVLGAWLERGDVSKKNSGSFYSMIQATNSHIRRLLNEKSGYEEELQRAKDLMAQRTSGLLAQFNHIEKVFSSASQKKAWDHFSRAQRRNIELWGKQTGEIKASLCEDALAERKDEEMDLSNSDSEEDPKKQDDEPPPNKKSRKWDLDTVNLREENDSLKCELEVAIHETDCLRVDLRAELEAKDAQLANLQQQLDAKMNDTQGTSTGSTGQCDSSSSSPRNPTNNPKPVPQECANLEDRRDNQNQPSTNTTTVTISQMDARLLGVISAFLNVHPFGASLDYIWSYGQKVSPGVRASEIEALMGKFPSLFRQETSGVGAGIERKWTFRGWL